MISPKLPIHGQPDIRDDYVLEFDSGWEEQDKAIHWKWIGNFGVWGIQGLEQDDQYIRIRDLKNSVERWMSAGSKEFYKNIYLVVSEEKWYHLRPYELPPNVQEGYLPGHGFTVYVPKS